MDISCCTQFKVASDTGQITGYGAVFNNVDQGQDRIAPGAFSKTLQGKQSLPMLAHHDPSRVVGVWHELKEDGRGLAVKGRISDTVDGRDIRQLAQDGAITGLSIGYWPSKADYVDDVRVIREIELVEVSVTAFPMNTLAQIASVKAALGRGDEISFNDLELILRYSGLSRRKAKRLLEHGFTGLSKQHQVAETLCRLATVFEDYS